LAKDTNKQQILMYKTAVLYASYASLYIKNSEYQKSDIVQQYIDT